MLIYNTTYHVEEGEDKNFLIWMQEHYLHEVEKNGTLYAPRIALSLIHIFENLKRIVPQIIQWTTTGEKGQTYEEASRLYYAVINQWNNYLYQVLANIGGIYIERCV